MHYSKSKSRPKRILHKGINIILPDHTNLIDLDNTDAFSVRKSLKSHCTVVIRNLSKGQIEYTIFNINFIFYRWKICRG